MKNAILKILIILSSIFITSCSKKPSFVIKKNFTGILTPNEWKVIGAFEFDTLKQKVNDTYQNKDLKSFGINEEAFEESDFDKFNDSKLKPFVVKCSNSPVRLFDHFDKKNIKNKSNCYLFTTVYSECDQEVVFMFDGSRNYKVWINKVAVLEVLNKENTIKNGDRFLRIKLHKGNNTVFAKVNRGTNQYSWGILMAVTSEKMAQKVFKENYLSDFVNDPIINDSLSLYLGPYANARLVITDINHKIRLEKICQNKNQKSFSVNCKELPKGLLFAKLVLGKDSIEELVYKGNMLEYVDRLKLEAKKLNSPDNVIEDIKAAVERLDFLFTKLDESSEASIRYYHRNILYYSTNLNKLITYTSKNKSDRFFSGNILKAYSLEKDTTVYHFLLHVNRKLTNGKPMPIVFFVPYALVEESLIKGWYIGNLDQIAIDSRTADEYGFATAWLFLKGKKYQSSKDAVVDIKHAINIIRKDYNLDTTNIFLNGECVGGQRALLMAERCPDLFAGVSVRCPVTMNGVEKDKPIDFVQNLSNVPVCIHHGLDDEQVPIQNSRDFVSEARKSGQSIKLIETSSGHLNFTNDARKSNFIYFNSLRRQQKTKNIREIHYSTFDVPSNVYWIKINKIKAGEKAEIIAKYNPSKHIFDIKTENILNYSILLTKIELSSGTKVSIYTNNTLNYKAVPNKDVINISVK